MKKLTYAQMKQVESQEYQATPVGNAFLNMTKLTELHDKKSNHECSSQDGTCMFCEQINAEIYAEQEPLVAWHLPRENGKTGSTEPF